MDFETFLQLFLVNLPQGLVLQQPGGGTSSVVWCREGRVCYRRKKWRFHCNVRDLYDTFRHFTGEVTTRQLKEHAPGVFDKKRGGHDCHCTFFFLALRRMGLAGEIWGGGKAGLPLGVTLAPHGATAGSG